MLALIPFPYRVLLLIGLITSLIGFGWIQGARHVQKNWDEEVQKQTIQALNLQNKTHLVTEKVVTKYVDRIVKVKDINNETIKAVPSLITEQDDSNCRLPIHFDWLHDASAKSMSISIPAGKSPDATSTTKLSTATETIVNNYGICHQTEERLKALQEWVRDQEKIYKGD